MPIVTVYSGSISLRASEIVNDEPFYELSKTIYGATLGELADNLVEYSVNAAREAQRWVTANKTEGYLLTEGYWRLLITSPDIMKCQQKTLPENIDSTFDSRALTFEEIVIITTSHRDAQIRQAHTHLQLVRSGPSELPELADRSYSILGDASSLEEITEFGLKGTELDTVLEIARLENRIASYQSHLKYDNRLANFESTAGKNNDHRSDTGDQPRKKIFGIF